MAVQTLKSLLDETQLMDVDQPQAIPGLENIPDFGDQATYQMFQGEGMPERMPFGLGNRASTLVDMVYAPGANNISLNV